MGRPNGLIHQHHFTDRAELPGDTDPLLFHFFIMYVGGLDVTAVHGSMHLRARDVRASYKNSINGVFLKKEILPVLLLLQQAVDEH